MPHITRDKQKSLVTRRHRSLLRPYRGPACTQVSYSNRERRPLPNRLCAQLEKALLSHSPDPAEENLARVSMDLFFREHPSVAPGDRRDDAQAIPFRNGSLKILQESNVLIIMKHVHVPSNVALIVQQSLADAGIRLFEVAKDLSHRFAGRGHLPLILGVSAQG